MELREDVTDAILRTVQQAGRDPDFRPLNQIYGKAVIDFHLADLIETHLIDGEIIKGISPPATHYIVRGLTAAAQRRLGIAASRDDLDE